MTNIRDIGNHSPEHMRRIGQQPGEPSRRGGMWDPDACLYVIEMAQEGMFPEEWAARLGISYRTLWTWRDRYSEFKAALETARIVLEAYWAKAVREIALGVALTGDESTIEGKPKKDKLTVAAANAQRIRTELVLEIVRKRFPHLWGKDGAVDQLQPPPGVELDDDEAQVIAPADVPKITDARLKQRIEELLARRGRAGVEKGKGE